MNQERLEEIKIKEIELNRLKEQWNKGIEEEKKGILNAKSKGMTKSLYLLGFVFESSSSRTAQYLEFHKVFKKELTVVLKPHIQEIKISKPNHFDVSGFLKLNNGKIYYINVGDLRWDKRDMLIRTAVDFMDYRGGSNGYIGLDNNFVDNLLKYLKVK